MIKMVRLIFISLFLIFLNSCRNSEKLNDTQAVIEGTEITPTDAYLNSLNDESTIIESSLKYKTLKRPEEFNYTILYRASDLMNESHEQKKINIINEEDSIIINYYVEIRGYSTVIPYCEVSDSVIDVKYYKPTDVRIIFEDGKWDTTYIGEATANILQLQMAFDKKTIGNKKVRIFGKSINEFYQYKDYCKIRAVKALGLAIGFMTKEYNKPGSHIIVPHIYDIEDSCYYFRNNVDDRYIIVNAISGKVSKK